MGEIKLNHLMQLKFGDKPLLHIIKVFFFALATQVDQFVNDCFIIHSFKRHVIVLCNDLIYGLFCCHRKSKRANHATPKARMPMMSIRIVFIEVKRLPKPKQASMRAQAL